MKISTTGYQWHVTQKSNLGWLLSQFEGGAEFGPGYGDSRNLQYRVDGRMLPNFHDVLDMDLMIRKDPPPKTYHKTKREKKTCPPIQRHDPETIRARSKSTIHMPLFNWASQSKDPRISLPFLSQMRKYLFHKCVNISCLIFSWGGDCRVTNVHGHPRMFPENPRFLCSLCSTLLAGPRRPLSLELRDAECYAP